MKKIVVLGAGYAGVLTAKKLAKKAKKADRWVDITLIDKNPFHTMLTELHEVRPGGWKRKAYESVWKKCSPGETWTLSKTRS